MYTRTTFTLDIFVDRCWWEQNKQIFKAINKYVCTHYYVVHKSCHRKRMNAFAGIRHMVDKMGAFNSGQPIRPFHLWIWTINKVFMIFRCDFDVKFTAAVYCNRSWTKYLIAFKSVEWQFTSWVIKHIIFVSQSAWNIIKVYTVQTQISGNSSSNNTNSISAISNRIAINFTSIHFWRLCFPSTPTFMESDNQFKSNFANACRVINVAYKCARKYEEIHFWEQPNGYGKS